MATLLDCFNYCSPINDPEPNNNNKYDNNNNKQCLGNLLEGILISVVEFITYKIPNTLTRLRLINRHWNISLDPNKSRVNLIWEKNICRYIFPYISSNLKIKRWDRYFQYKLHCIIWDKYDGDKSQFYRDLDATSPNIFYLKNKIIEGCIFDLEVVNNYHRHIQTKPNMNMTMIQTDHEYDAYSGLPVGFGRKFKCPITVSKLQKHTESKMCEGDIDAQTDTNPAYFCRNCKKNIYTATSIKELEQKVDNGECASLVFNTNIHQYTFTKSSTLRQLVDNAYARGGVVRIDNGYSNRRSMPEFSSRLSSLGTISWHSSHTTTGFAEDIESDGKLSLQSDIGSGSGLGSGSGSPPGPGPGSGSPGGVGSNYSNNNLTVIVDEEQFAEDHETLPSDNSQQIVIIQLILMRIEEKIYL